jgi:nucleoid-associated protein YgaU
VVTETDDSLWRVSKMVYGRGDFYKALYLHNKAQLAYPDRIAAGIQIVTPSAAELRRLYPSACPEERGAVAP